jgi:hypothetical protein
MDRRNQLSKKGKTTVKIKANLKARKLATKHSRNTARGLKVKTNVKAGDGGAEPNRVTANHNQTTARGVRVKTGVRAGQDKPPVIR